MAKVSDHERVRPTVLDRLIDDEPENRESEPPRTRAQTVRILKHSVRRDIENLLNTRRRCKSFPPDAKELEISMVNYGVPDFAKEDLSSDRGRAEFRRVIETVLRNFEPRLHSIKVHVYDDPDEIERVLRFRVDGVLEADPAPEPVSFDTSMDPATRAFEVTGRLR